MPKILLLYIVDSSAALARLNIQASLQCLKSLGIHGGRGFSIFCASRVLGEYLPHSNNSELNTKQKPGPFLSRQNWGSQYPCFADNFMAQHTRGECGRPWTLAYGNLNLNDTLISEPLWRVAGVMDSKERLSCSLVMTPRQKDETSELSALLSVLFLLFRLMKVHLKSKLPTDTLLERFC